jgi:nucleoside-diphosphate-sugar epimerase
MATLQAAGASNPVSAIRDALSTTTVIFSNVYGPRQREDFGAVNIFARRALSGEPVTLYGDGRNVRDYVHVADAVRTLMWAGGCQASSRPRRMLPERVMCGTGVGTTDADLWKLVCRVVGEVVGREILPLEMTEFAPARPADIRSMVFDFPEGFAGRTPLDVGVRMLVENLCKEGVGQ